MNPEFDIKNLLRYKNKYGESLHYIKPEIIDISCKINNLTDKIITTLKMVGQIAIDLNSEVYLVGGFVRDLLLNKKNFDLDLVVVGNIKDVIIKTGKKLSKEWNFNPEFKTGYIELDSNFTLDFALARRETYRYSGAMPDVQPTNIIEDLFRRDYTVNTILLGITPAEWGIVYDFLGGIADLEDHKLRILHENGFKDDPTRIIRGLKLALKLNFIFEKNTDVLINNALKMDYPQLSISRVFKELKQLLQIETDSVKILSLIDEYPIFNLLNIRIKINDQKLEQFKEMARYLEYLKKKNYNIEEWLIKLVILLDSIPEVKIKELVINNKIKDLLLFTGTNVLKELENTFNPIDIYKLLQNKSSEELLLMLINTDDKSVKKKIKYFLNVLSEVELEIDGYDLQKLGLKPGPEIKEVLNTVWKVKIQGKVSNHSEELELARNIIEKEMEV